MNLKLSGWNWQTETSASDAERQGNLSNTMKNNEK